MPGCYNYGHNRVLHLIPNRDQHYFCEIDMTMTTYCWCRILIRQHLLLMGFLLACTCVVRADSREDGKREAFLPDQTVLPVAPPAKAIVLLDGKGTNQFLSMAGTPTDWPIDDGVLQSSRGTGRTNHVVSQVHFRDADIHAEFMLPAKGSGNSGLYIHGNYELQIINSGGDSKPGMNDMGALYGFSKPLVNASRPPGQWQVYDVRYRAPRRNSAGEISNDGILTAWLNGKLVHDGTTFGEPRSTYHPFRYGTTPYLQKIWLQQKRTMTGPLFLQDHDNPVRFRNVWICPLDEHALTYEPTAE
jgi:hypothetical protein